jgi:hypothetical protein
VAIDQPDWVAAATATGAPPAPSGSAGTTVKTPAPK